MESESEDEEEEEDSDGAPRKRSKRATKASRSASPAISADMRVEKILDVRESGESEEQEFLVKFLDRSYLHVQWLTLTQLPQYDPGWQGRVKRFLAKPLSAHHYSESEPFNPSFLAIDRIVSERESADGSREFYVKWQAQPYASSTWESEDDLLNLVSVSRK